MYWACEMQVPICKTQVRHRMDPEYLEENFPKSGYLHATYEMLTRTFNTHVQRRSRAVNWTPEPHLCKTCVLQIPFCSHISNVYASIVADPCTRTACCMSRHACHMLLTKLPNLKPKQDLFGSLHARHLRTASQDMLVQREGHSVLNEIKFLLSLWLGSALHLRATEPHMRLTDVSTDALHTSPKIACVELEAYLA
ncbi:hypothetical protein HAX54_045086 [Datura stramonium]|uniref:Uncharacterized protein n=1 Tax=Datura stramonium TaxID=4076 RepID=A0ABS8WHD6_DATST|nr:hypothetical protein [Datura stramonium]